MEQESFAVGERGSVLTLRLPASPGACVAGQSRFPSRSGRKSHNLCGALQGDIAINSPAFGD